MKAELAEKQLRAVEGSSFSMWQIIGHVHSVLTYLRRALGLVLGLIVVVASCCAVGNLLASRWPVLRLSGTDYSAVYLAEFGGVLAFGAITVAIGIWKFSFAETRLVQKASSLSDKFLDIAYQLEDEYGHETKGTIALKRIGETLDRVSIVPVGFRAEMVAAIKALAPEPEMTRLRPSLLAACLGIEVPVMDRRMWQAQVSLALRFIVFCALMLLSFAILEPYDANIAVVVFSILTVIVGLQATLRFISTASSRPRTPDLRWHLTQLITVRVA